MQRLFLLCAALVCAFSIVPTTPTHAATSGRRITIDARVGYANTYFAESWTPVTLTIAGGDAPQPVRVEWVVTADAQPTITWQRDLVVDPAQPTVVDTVMVLPSYARSIIVRVRADGDIVASTQIDAQVAAGVVNLVVADQTTLADAFTNTIKEDGSGGVVRVIPAAALPSTVTALQGVNTILIADTSQLTPAQLAALRVWVGVGGRLAFSGVAPAPFADIAPFSLTSGSNSTTLTPALPRAVTIPAVAPHPDAVSMHSDTPLLYRRDVGRGQVIQSALAVGDTDAWSGQYWYWQPVLAGTVNPYAATMPLPATNAVFDPLVMSLTVPAVQQPAPWFLFLIAVGYIILVGPVTFFVLKRRNQLDAAWLTIPVTAAVVAVVLVGTVYVSRGTSPRLYGLQVIQLDAHAATAYTTTTVGVYAPFRTTFAVSAPASNTLQQLAFATPGGVGSVSAVDGTLTVPAPIGSMRFVTTSSVAPAPLTVSHTLTRSPDLLHGSLRLTGVPLRDAYLQIGSFAQALGDLEAGTDVRVDITQNTPMFPCGVPDTQGDMVSVQRVYEHITGPCGAVNAQLDGRATLYGWISQPTEWPTVAGVPYTDQRQFVAITLNVP